MRIGGSAIILVPRSGIDAVLAEVRPRILLCLFPIGPDPREANPDTDENADAVSKHDPMANATMAAFEESQGIARPPLRSCFAWFLSESSPFNHFSFIKAEIRRKVLASRDAHARSFRAPRAHANKCELFRIVPCGLAGLG